MQFFHSINLIRSLDLHTSLFVNRGYTNCNASKRITNLREIVAQFVHLNDHLLLF